MRTDEDLKRMESEDTAVGLHCYYWQLSNYINSKGYKTGIEIGTAYGGCANHLLTECKLEKLICVDPYKYYPDMPGLFDQDDYDRLSKQTYKRLMAYTGKYLPLIMDSKAAFELIEMNKDYPKSNLGKQVDFVFLDGLHTYEMVKWEIEHYSKLIRPGGALLGHDYDTFKGVKKAVDEYCKPIMLELNLWLKEL